jgi:hypothetical protein
MSRTTFFKRIAVTAIAALGFGTLSVAPSQALVVSQSISFDADDAVKTGESATAVLTHVITGTATTDSSTVRVLITSSNAAYVSNLYMRVSDSSTNVSQVSGNSSTSPIFRWGQASGTAPASAATANGTGDAGLGFDATKYDSRTVQINASGATSATAKYTVGLYNITAAGTYTVKAIIENNPGGAAAIDAASATWTVTVTAADKTASGASTVTLRQTDEDTTAPFGGTRDGTDSGTLVRASSTATSTDPEFSLFTLQRTASGTNIAQESFTVTVSGEAYVTAASGTRPNSGNGVKTMQFAVGTVGTAVESWIWSSGTAGTATVTVTSASGLVLGTKTLTFAGTVTTLAVDTKYKNVIRAGTSTAQDDVVLLKATDAAGNRVRALTISGVSSDVSVLTSGSCADTAADGSTADGYYLCSVTPTTTSKSGQKATITWRTLLSTGAYVTTTQDFTMGGAVNTVTLATDKATYEPGAVMVITATAKDSSGNTPYDGQSGISLSANKQLGAAISMSTYLAGVSTSKSLDSDGSVLNDKNLYAPAASGSFIVAGTFTDAALSTVAVSATATVGDDGAIAAANAATDAAAEAIDAANAATDAANLAAEAADAATVAAEEARDAADAATAAVEALATEVATLMAALKAQITTLANTVAKIAKKVKA